ncbi:MAG: hypothetical protein HY901_00955, partial [Deltaproteobacteria bacterium]|nr:hypothetical protein [Deltaproteobacteria bacterium]
MSISVWEQHLERALRRVQEVIAEGQQRQQRAAGEWARQAQAVASSVEHQRLQRQAARQMRRKAKREERRLARIEQASVARGVVLTVFAVALLVFAALNQAELWWLVFVALPMGLGASRNLSRAWERQQMARAKEGATSKKKPRVPSPFPEIDARLTRVDALCEKLLGEVKDGPAVLREFVSRPAETVQALRKTCHELARRERELRTVASSSEEKRVLSERVALGERIGRETDPIVRERLSAAMAALDDQLRQRQELSTAAARLEAEGTQILYTLENLATQVLRVKSADAGSRDVAGAGLRRCLEQITLEVDAVADALESV